MAARQHGVVTHAQLLAAGLDRDAIEYRRRVGRLHLLHRGVYAVGHRPPSPLATAIAAVLACGPDAVLSHRSACGALEDPASLATHGGDYADQAPAVPASTSTAHPTPKRPPTTGSA